jgi:hypothetical protein
LNPQVFFLISERERKSVLWFLSKGLEPRTLRLGARTEKGNNNKKERRRRKKKAAWWVGDEARVKTKGACCCARILSGKGA